VSANPAAAQALIPYSMKAAVFLNALQVLSALEIPVLPVLVPVRPAL